MVFGWLVGRLVRCLADELVGYLVAWLLGCLVDCLVASLVGWLVGWLLGCLVGGLGVKKRGAEASFYREKRVT